MRYKFILPKVAIAKSLRVTDFEDLFIHGTKEDIVVALFPLVEAYVDKPSEKTKKRLGDFIDKTWTHLPKELTSSGKAYRLWLFDRTKTEDIIDRLANKKAFSIRQSNFLSYTTKQPKSDTALKRFWSVFRSAAVKPGCLVLLQQQDYRKGFLIPEFFKYLLDNDYLIPEEEYTEGTEDVFEFIDEDLVKLVNEEQEVLIFDPALNIKLSDILNIMIAVTKTYNSPGALIRGVKYVKVPDINKAKNILSEI